MLSIPRDLWGPIPGQGSNRDQLRLRHRRQPADPDHPAGPRHPHQPLRRGQLRHLPRHQQRGRRGQASTSRPRPRTPTRSQHPGRRLLQPEGRPGPGLRAVPPLRVLPERLLALRGRERPGPHPAPAGVHQEDDQEGRRRVHQPARPQQHHRRHHQEPHRRQRLQPQPHAQPGQGLPLHGRRRHPEPHPADLLLRHRRRRRRPGPAAAPGGPDDRRLQRLRHPRPQATAATPTPAGTTTTGRHRAARHGGRRHR